MTGTDALGFLAAGLVLATFCMKQLIPLRALAITSNVTFILYGYWAGIEPVLMLHVILLPVNVFRLLQALQDGVSGRFPGLGDGKGPDCRTARRGRAASILPVPLPCAAPRNRWLRTGRASSARQKDPPLSIG
jgi:hypothetical protein